MRQLIAMTTTMTLVALAFGPAVWAEDIQGKVKSVDPSGKKLILEDGTQLMIPPDLPVQAKNLKPGSDVKASYKDGGGNKIITSIEVRPAK